MTWRLDFGTIHRKLLHVWVNDMHFCTFWFWIRDVGFAGCAAAAVAVRPWGYEDARHTDRQGHRYAQEGQVRALVALCVCVRVYVCTSVLRIHTYIYIYTYMDRLERPYVFSGTAHFACLNWASKCNWTKHDAESPDHFVYTSIFVCIYMLFYM